MAGQEDGKKLAERMRTEAGKVLRFFELLPSNSWERKIYTGDTSWTLRQVLAHFVSSEEAFSYLVADILSGGQGAPDGFDIDRFNEKDISRYQDFSLIQLLDRFTQMREQNARMVERLDAGDLARKGRHPFLGDSTVEDIVKLIYRHNQIHLRDIRKMAGLG